MKIANCNTLQDMNYYLVSCLSQTDGQTDRQTESDAYETTVQLAQVGSKIARLCKIQNSFSFAELTYLAKAKPLEETGKSKVNI